MKNKDYYHNKIVLITGGAKGLGLALGQSMMNYGATVILSDVDNKALEKIASESVGLHTVYLDVSKYVEYQEVVSKIVEEHGKIDILVNNAGVCVAGEIAHLEMNHWMDAINTNLRGTIHGCDIAAKVMIKQGFGQIVNIASISGLGPFSGNGSLQHIKIWYRRTESNPKD